MNASFDVVIVGGGVTGAAVGYGLAKRGVKTCLVDAVPTFSRASRANMGLIWCQSMCCERSGCCCPTASWRRS